MTLPPSFLSRPLAHRGYHAHGRPENSLGAARAAIEAGYGIEMDVQCASDGVAMVFHDDVLDRLTGSPGRVAAHTADELGQLHILGTDERVPTLVELLAVVDGRVPLLIEIKDQSLVLGPDIGPLGAGIAAALDGYKGDVALMSFNPHAVAEMRDLLPDVPRGLTTGAFDPADWNAPPGRCDELRAIPDYGATGACFVSHQASDLARPRVAELKAQGAAILCWTIRSHADEVRARRIADNVTFEGYAA